MARLTREPLFGTRSVPPWIRRAAARGRRGRGPRVLWLSPPLVHAIAAASSALGLAAHAPPQSQSQSQSQPQPLLRSAPKGSSGPLSIRKGARRYGARPAEPTSPSPSVRAVRDLGTLDCWGFVPRTTSPRFEVTPNQ